MKILCKKKHIMVATQETESFMGREDVLDQVRSYIVSKTQRRAYIIHGPTGSGKTCLLGKVATLAGGYRETSNLVKDLDLLPCACKVVFNTILHDTW